MGNPDSASCRVLVVEDEPAAREATRRFLKHCGHDVFVAEDCSSAMQIADEFHPHVLVSDCNLQGRLDGLKLAREIQRKYGAAVILVSAYRSTMLQERLDGLEVVDYLKKPVSLKTLENSVSSVAQAA